MHYIKCMFLNLIPCQISSVFSPRHLLHVLSPPPTSSIIFGDLLIVGALFVCFSTKPLCALWPLGWQPTASVLQRHPRRSGILHGRRPRQYGQRPPVSLLQSGPEPGAPAEVQGGGDEGPGWQRLLGLVGLKNRKRKRKKEVMCTGGRRECSTAAA